MGAALPTHSACYGATWFNAPIDLLMLSLSIASLALQMPHSDFHDLPFDDLVDNDKDPLCYKFCPTRMNSWGQAVRHLNLTKASILDDVRTRHDLVCRAISPPLLKPRHAGGPFWFVNTSEVDLIKGVNRHHFAKSDFLEEGHLYQFGIGRQGVTLRQLIQTYMGPKAATVAWGLDTFEGIPEPDAVDATTLDFVKGGFAAFGGVKASEQLTKAFAPRDVRWVIGPYNESLKEGKALAERRGMKPAVYVDVDCDMYSGAYFGLDFLFSSGLIVKGTVIGYDDYWNFPCVARSETQSVADLEKYGEARAHAEMTIKHHVRFRCLCGACKHHEGEMYEMNLRTYFVVESVGDRSKPPSTGLELNAEKIQSLLNHYDCVAYGKARFSKVTPPKAQAEASHSSTTVEDAPADESKDEHPHMHNGRRHWPRAPPPAPAPAPDSLELRLAAVEKKLDRVVTLLERG